MLPRRCVLPWETPPCRDLLPDLSPTFPPTFAPEVQASNAERSTAHCHTLSVSRFSIIILSSQPAATLEAGASWTFGVV